MQSFLKIQIFSMASTKKRQKVCHEKACFSTRFCYFYIDYIKVGFKQIYGYVKHGDVSKTILFEFFNFLNISKIHFK
jgi:hypothetical protein